MNNDNDYPVTGHLIPTSRPDPQTAIEKLSEVLRYVYSTSRGVHKPIIAEALEKYGVPHAPKNKPCTDCAERGDYNRGHGHAVGYVPIIGKCPEHRTKEKG